MMAAGRVVYVEPLGVLGGMGHYNDSLVPAYASAGFVVTVVTTSASPVLSQVARVRISRAFRLALRRGTPAILRAAGYLAALLGVLRWCGRDDLVVLHFMHLPAVDQWWLRAVHARGARLVLVAHDPIPVAAAGPDQPYLACLAQMDLLVVHGETAQRDLLRLGVPDRRIRLAPFGRFRMTAPMNRQAAAELLGLPELRRPIAVIVGHLKPGKGIGRVIDSLAKEPRAIGTLLLAGSRQGHGPLDDAIATAVRYGVPLQRVERRLTDAEELAAYSLADVVLALYESGYSSGVVARAHAVGRPVVLTDVGDLRAQAAPGDVVVEPDYSAGSLMTAIQSALAGCEDRVEPEDAQPDGRWRQHVGTVIAALGLDECEADPA